MNVRIMKLIKATFGFVFLLSSISPFAQDITKIHQKLNEINREVKSSLLGFEVCDTILEWNLRDSFGSCSLIHQLSYYFYH